MPAQCSQNIARQVSNLRRIEGQVRALQRQLEGDADFLLVLTQTAAASKALQSVARRLVEEHVAQTMQAFGDDEAAKQAAAKQLNQVVERLLKI